MQLTLLLSLAVYRLTRLIVKDTVWETTRTRLEAFILGRKPVAWRDKIHELFTCHYCMSVWIAAAATFGTDLFTSVPMPVLNWLAASAGAVAIWRYVEE